MEHTQKMFLVPQHQLGLVKQQPHYKQQDQRESIRQAVQNELDRAMIDVLNQPDTDMYEKAKKYSVILQRYLAVVRQGEREKGALPLPLPSGESDTGSNPVVSADDVPGKDVILGNVIRHIPKKSKKHAEYILDALNHAKNDISWTDRGEIVVNNQTIKGTHLYDLVKSVTSSYNVLDESRPIGWKIFLKTLADLNIPLSAIPNTQVRRSIAEYKGGDAVYDGGFNVSGSFKTKTRTSRSIDSTPFKTPKSLKTKFFRSDDSWEDF